MVVSCVLCLGLPLDALALNRQRTLGAPEKEEKLLKRVRRGWMWNQFFLQEEYTGSDYQYIGKVRPAPQPTSVAAANRKRPTWVPLHMEMGKKRNFSFSQLCVQIVEVFCATI